MQKYLLKQQFKGFSMSSSKGLHKGYDRFQTLLSQSEIHSAGVSNKDANQKFLSAPQLDYDDLEQINVDDIEEIDLKWQVAMISMRIKKFYKRTGRKLQFDTKGPIGFEKTKVECFNCHKMGNFASDCRAKGNQDSRRRYDGYNGNKDRDNNRRFDNEDDPYKALKDKGIVNSECSRHMIGNKAHLADYQQFNGGSVAFGGSNGRITGKGKINAGRIKREYCNAKTPQQNRVAERKHMTLIEAARTMLADSFLPTTFWTEAVNTACYVLNREIDLHDEHFVLPIWSAYSTTVKSSRDKILKISDFKTCEKPASPAEQIFQEELEKLKRQENKANDAARKEATHENQDANTNSTNLLNAVSTPISIAGPLIALSDDEPSYPDDPSLPHLKDIYVSPSEGIFTDSSSNDEGVFKIQKVWILVDLPFRKKAIGTKWVYRNIKDERGVVVRNKACLVAQGHRQEEGIYYDKVFAPMARIEAIRIFLAFASYTSFIVYQMDVKSAFLYGTIDEEVYVTQPPGFEDPNFTNKVYKIVKALYGLHQALRACSTKKSWCDVFEELMKNRFQMSSIGELTFFLGLQVKVKTASTLIETQKPLVKDEEDADVDIQVTPKTSHLQAVKKIFRYLKGQPKLGVWYPNVSTFDLEAYSDSDYVGANIDRKSTTGGCQFLGRRLILWQYKKQTIMATSTTEAEYVAAAHCCG
nr:putative ribonuclease H-like domain-containing protein [Tanacetum cinerariifolium]